MCFHKRFQRANVHLLLGFLRQLLALDCKNEIEYLQNSWEEKKATKHEFLTNLSKVRSSTAVHSFEKKLNCKKSSWNLKKQFKSTFPGLHSLCHATLRLRERHRQRHTNKRDTNRNWTKISITPRHTSPSRSTVGSLWYLHDVTGLVASLHTKSSFPLLFFSAFKLCLYVLKTGVRRTNVTPRRI